MWAIVSEASPPGEYHRILGLGRRLGCCLLQVSASRSSRKSFERNHPEPETPVHKPVDGAWLVNGGPTHRRVIAPSTCSIAWRFHHRMGSQVVLPLLSRTSPRGLLEWVVMPCQKPQANFGTTTAYVHVTASITTGASTVSSTVFNSASAFQPG